MFAFSLPKIFLLLVTILLVWNFFKFLERKSNKNNVKDTKNLYEEENDLKADESLIECNKCGSFYSLDLEKRCPECKSKNKNV